VGSGGTWKSERAGQQQRLASCDRAACPHSIGTSRAEGAYRNHCYLSGLFDVLLRATHDERDKNGGNRGFDVLRYAAGFHEQVGRGSSKLLGMLRATAARLRTSV